jgi:hypothetical protein
MSLTKAQLLATSPCTVLSDVLSFFEDYQKLYSKSSDNPHRMAGQFHWSFPGLDQRSFTAFANLLALRNGGQIEILSPCDVIQDEDGSDEGSVDTSRPNQISDSGHNKLKKRFLDCLAEFVANDKGGKFVACSSMREGEDCMTIWITRNGGFQSLEETLSERLSELLSNLSSRSGGMSPLILNS